MPRASGAGRSDEPQADMRRVAIPQCSEGLSRATDVGETGRHTGRPEDEPIDRAACRTSEALFFFAGWHALRPRKTDAGV